MPPLFVGLPLQRRCYGRIPGPRAGAEIQAACNRSLTLLGGQRVILRRIRVLRWLVLGLLLLAKTTHKGTLRGIHLLLEESEIRGWLEAKVERSVRERRYW